MPLPSRSCSKAWSETLFHRVFLFQLVGIDVAGAGDVALKERI
jgi:hypothetical protein